MYHYDAMHLGSFKLRRDEVFQIPFELIIECTSNLF